MSPEQDDDVTPDTPDRNYDIDESSGTDVVPDSKRELEEEDE